MPRPWHERYAAVHVKHHHRQLFFRKTTDWSAEWEYRWVLRNSVPVPGFVDFRHSLCAVIVGHAFPDRAKDTLHHLAKDLGHVPIGHFRWRNGGSAFDGFMHVGVTPDRLVQSQPD